MPYHGCVRVLLHINTQTQTYCTSPFLVLNWFTWQMNLTNVIYNSKGPFLAVLGFGLTTFWSMPQRLKHLRSTTQKICRVKDKWTNSGGEETCRPICAVCECVCLLYCTLNILFSVILSRTQQSQQKILNTQKKEMRWDRNRRYECKSKQKLKSISILNRETHFAYDASDTNRLLSLLQSFSSPCHSHEL